MADTREIALGDGLAPNGYVLGPGDSFGIESIQATFDGSAAMTDFLPCATIYGPDGRKLSRTFPASTMAAGDSGGVTYAPF